MPKKNVQDATLKNTRVLHARVAKLERHVAKLERLLDKVGRAVFSDS